MPKNKWNQSRTDALVEKILGCVKMSNRWYKNGEPVLTDGARFANIYYFQPLTNLNHCLMLVENEWFGERFGE